MWSEVIWIVEIKKDMVHTIKWNFFSLDLSTDLENNSVSIFIISTLH